MTVLQTYHEFDIKKVIYKGRNDCENKKMVIITIIMNAGKRSTAKNYRPASLLPVVSKVIEKLVSNRIDHLEKCGLF